MKTNMREPAIRELKHALEERFGKSIRLYLFGSSARDEHSELSDIYFTWPYMRLLS
jgi:predicted nucleotidyltransferase